MQVTMPENIEQYTTKGSFTDSLGNEVYFEIPAVFVESVLDEEETLKRIEKFIENYELIHNKINT